MVTVRSETVDLLDRIGKERTIFEIHSKGTRKPHFLFNHSVVRGRYVSRDTVLDALCL